MLLSIVVPFYNMEAYLETCLESVLLQDVDRERVEVILVNDGSDDNSGAIAEAYAARHSNIRLLTQHQKGLGAARNAGFREAVGRYVLFVDSDDYLASNVLGYLLRVIERNRLDVLAFTFAWAWPGRHMPDPRVPVSSLGEVDVTTGMEYFTRNGALPNVWAYLFDSEYLRGLAIEFDEGHFMEDTVFVVEAVCAARRIASTPLDAYRYLQRPDSIMTRVGTAHARQMVMDYERAVFGLDAVRRRRLHQDASLSQYSKRLTAKEQAFVFYMVSRYLRSDLQIKPDLFAALKRLHSVGMYPLTVYPAADQGIRYRAAAWLFNRPWTLRPLARAVRLVRDYRAWRRSAAGPS